MVNRKGNIRIQSRQRLFVALLEITGYATAIFLSEMLVKIWSHG